MLTPNELRELFTYQPETGEIRWRISAPPNITLNAQAGNKSFYGRRVITWCGKKYYASRIAWALYTGEWPTHSIDHIDGDTLNDRVANLRDVTHRVNMQNQRQINPDRIPLGIRPNGNGWMARLSHDNQTIYLGTRDKMWKAGLLYRRAKRRMHEGNTL